MSRAVAFIKNRATPTASPAPTTLKKASEAEESPSSRVLVNAFSDLSFIAEVLSPLPCCDSRSDTSEFSPSFTSRPITAPLPHDDENASATELAASLN